MTIPRPEPPAPLLPALAVALFVTCATAWALAIPAFETPDEVGHARYVNFVRQEGALPAPGVQAAGEAHQPPLYYALAAGVSAAAGWDSVDVNVRRNPRFVWYGGDEAAKYAHAPSERPALAGTAAPLHRLRLVSVLMGSITVLLVFRLARLAGMGSPAASLVCGLAAFTPQFTFISASLNNDNLANLAGAGCLCLLVAALRAPARSILWWMAGTVAGLGLLAKFTTATMLACGAAAAWLGAATGRERLMRPAAFLLPALFLPAPLLLWNLRRWGDPFGAGAQVATLPQLVDRKSLFSAYFVTDFPGVLFRSFWGTFGWMSFPMPSWVDALFILLSLAGLAGLLQAARAGSLTRVHGLLGAAVGAQIAQVAIYNLTFTQAQGRFLFPILGAAMVLLGTGLGASWQRWGGSPPTPRAAAGALVLMAGANLSLLVFWVMPGYTSAGG